jgi:hypothetical protein
MCCLQDLHELLPHLVSASDHSSQIHKPINLGREPHIVQYSLLGTSGQETNTTDLFMNKGTSPPTCICVLMIAFPINVAEKNLAKGTRKWPQVMPARSKSGLGICNKGKQRVRFLQRTSSVVDSIANPCTTLSSSNVLEALRERRQGTVCTW